MPVTVNVSTGEVRRTGPQKVVAVTQRGGVPVAPSVKPTDYPTHWFPELKASAKRRGRRVQFI